MKEKIVEILSFGIEPERAELKALQLIILFNEHILSKAHDSSTVAEMLDKSFIKNK